MEIKATTKKEVVSGSGLDGVEILVKNISVNLNSHNDEKEIVLILKTIISAITDNPLDYDESDLSFLRVVYDNLKPINSPGFDSVLDKFKEKDGDSDTPQTNI